MAIFPHLETENIVQVGDLTRLSAARSIATPDEEPISLIEIRPEENAPWFNVTEKGFLDWVFADPGDKIAEVRVATGESSFAVVEAGISVLTEAADNLFASDSELTAWEPDVLNYIRPGRASFKDVHREAQTQILDWFDAKGIRDVTGQRLTAAAVVDVKEVKEWAKFLALQIIFEGVSNAVDDVFSRKAEKYSGLASRARNRSELKLDFNGDGQISQSERVGMTSVGVKRL
jgi:hypothetical protein